MADWTLLSGLTLLAIFVGPVAAILVAQFLDRRRERVHRRMEIFRTLMRTRRTPMWAEHVGALNLVEIAFAGVDAVIAAWKDLFEHLGSEPPRRSSEELGVTMSPEEQTAANRRFHGRIATERAERLAVLLHAIAKNVGHKAEQLEIFKGGYTPQGYADVEFEHRMIRQFVLDLYVGKRVVPVGVVEYRPAEPPTD